MRTPDLATMTLVEDTSLEKSPEQAVSIDSLVQDYYPYVRRLALSILDDPHEAEDAAQETFIAACGGLAGFRKQAHIRTWLTTIAVNTCRGRLRRRKVRRAVQTAFTALQLSRPQPVTPEERVILGEARHRLWQTVDALDEKHRLPVILRYVHELSVPEIATALEISEGTVHSRLHYARQKLQASLDSLAFLSEGRDRYGSR